METAKCGTARKHLSRAAFRSSSQIRKQGFARLRQFLEIPNSKYIEALLDTEGVKDAVQHVSVAGLRGADRRRVLLTAFYGMPDSRREFWRNALARLRLRPTRHVGLGGC